MSLAKPSPSVLKHPVRWPSETSSLASVHQELTETRAQLAAVTRQRDELLKSISHDLKNPLTAVLVSAALLEERVQKFDGEEGAKLTRLATSLRNSGSRMNEMIDRTVDIFRVRAGTLRLKHKVEDIVSLLDEAFENALPAAYAQNVCLERDPLETSAQLMCDRRRILQLLSILFANAIRHSNPEAHVHFSASVENDRLQMTLRDNGAGFATGEPEAFFHFEGFGNSQSRGASLYLANGIARAHGGELRAQNQNGAVVTVWLPLAPITT